MKELLMFVICAICGVYLISFAPCFIEPAHKLINIAGVVVIIGGIVQLIKFLAEQRLAKKGE